MAGPIKQRAGNATKQEMRPPRSGRFNLILTAHIILSTYSSYLNNVHIKKNYVDGENLILLIVYETQAKPKPDPKSEQSRIKKRSN